MNFDEAFTKLVSHEGGFQDDPNDPGNWTGGKMGHGELKGTKYGIAANTFPGEDIKNLTLTRAREIYRFNYWGPAGCDAVPDGLKFDLFDTAVNSGQRQAARLLQRAVGVADDGIIGPRTLQAVQSMDPERLIARFNGWRLDFMNDLPTWPSFGRGWTQRIAENLKAV